MAYQQIEDYGIIGNMRTAALIGVNGSIDWMCYPHFDSPGIFSRLLDENRGGFFQIAPVVLNSHGAGFYSKSLTMGLATSTPLETDGASAYTEKNEYQTRPEGGYDCVFICL